MKRLRSSLNRIAVRVPVFMVAVAVMFAIVAATSIVWTRHTTALLSDLSERDLRARDIVTKLSAETEALNTRLLGVMANVYSSPGSADRVKRIVDAILAQWQALDGVLPESFKGAEWTAAAGATTALRSLAPRADETLKASKPLAPVYDAWLDIAAPLRKSNQSVTLALDRHLREQIAADIELAAVVNRLTVILSVISLALLVLVGWNMIARVARPIGVLTGLMNRVASGDCDISVPGTKRGDEVGSIARAVEVFRESMLRVRALSLAERKEAAARERRHKAMEGFTGDFSSAVSGVLRNFAESADRMREAVGSVLEAASTTRERMGELRATSEVSSGNLSTVAAASEEMLASIDEIRRQVESAAEISTGAVREASRSREMVGDLTAAAQRIGDVVKLIDEIANQTNLLALNATIEAARAGEAGRGFAVVANEVKSLAGQTSKATTEIAERVQRIQTSTDEAAKAIGAVAEVVGKVDEISRGIAGAIDQQTEAVREIVRNVQSASAGTATATAAVGDVAASTEIAQSAAQRVLTATATVSSQAGELRAEVESFLKAMSSAGDRREFVRYAYERDVVLVSTGGSRSRARLADVSRGGARILGKLPVAIGDSCTLDFDGATVPVRVVRASDGEIGVTFQLDDATTLVVGPIVEAAMAAEAGATRGHDPAAPAAA